MSHFSIRAWGYPLEALTLLYRSLSASRCSVSLGSSRRHGVPEAGYPDWHLCLRSLLSYSR